MKKILIIGNSIKEYTLAKYLSNIADVYVASGSENLKGVATVVDIREDSVSELLEFVMENGIDLTMAFSKKTLQSDIVSVFTNNNQQIFAPQEKSSRIVFDKAFAKKILYKLRVSTPKFGIFEKQSMAVDYVKNQKSPFVIKTNDDFSAIVLTSPLQAKTILDSMFAEKNQRVIIEDYVWGTPFSFYTLTDGYKALPLGSSIVYKHTLEGDGGQLTSGMGACSPNYRLSEENEYYLMDNVIYPTLDMLEIEGNPYVGVLGVNGIITDDGRLQVLGYQSFMQDVDCQSILDVLDDNFLDLCEACVIGSFSDEVEFVKQKNIASVSIALHCNNKENVQNIVYGIDNLDETTSVAFYPNIKKNRYLEFEAQKGPVMILSATARTVNTACEKVYSEVVEINFKGMTYRKDICKPIKSVI